ncbi:hypothetical protein AgCh_016179 [Apium graveolens]
MDGSHKNIGSGNGAGFNINVPWWSKHRSKADYIAVWDIVLLPVARQFKLVWSLLDLTHAKDDPIGDCNLTAKGSRDIESGPVLADEVLPSEVLDDQGHQNSFMDLDSGKERMAALRSARRLVSPIVFDNLNNLSDAFAQRVAEMGQTLSFNISMWVCYVHTTEHEVDLLRAKSESKQIQDLGRMNTQKISSTKIPTFDKANYTLWIKKMLLFIGMANSLYIQILKNRPFTPMVRVEESTDGDMVIPAHYAPKDPSEYTKPEK